jgi:hypothetical protein
MGAFATNSPDTTFEHRTHRGELRIWLAAPTVMVFKYRGHSDRSYVDFLEHVVDEVFGARNDLHFLVDCEEQTGFDAQFRKRIAEWAKRLEPRTLTYCLLVRSRVVALGISVVSLLVGGKSKVVSDRDTFLSVLELAVRRSTGAAGIPLASVGHSG